jgi:hypothetical protein
MATTLKCGQCGHENESERIYCHNCGAKLDRTLLPEESKDVESSEQARKRIRKLTNPKSGFFLGAWKSLLKALVFAVIVAALIEIARPPGDVPKPADKDTLLDSQELLIKINNAQTQKNSLTFALTEEQMNKYLQATIKEQATGLIGDEVKFKRVYVHCVQDDPKQPGVCWIWSEQSLFDYSLFASAGYQLSIANNQVNAKCVGGYLGRLPVHPLLMQYGDVMFSKIYETLAHEHKTMNQMQSIEVQKGRIVFVTKPGP